MGARQGGDPDFHDAADSTRDASEEVSVRRTVIPLAEGSHHIRTESRVCRGERAPLLPILSCRDSVRVKKISERKTKSEGGEEKTEGPWRSG